MTFFAIGTGFSVTISFLILFFMYFLLEDHSVTERQCAQNAHQKALLWFWLHAWLKQLF